MYSVLPVDMSRYLSNNGWHFNKKMCECAVKKMVSRTNGKKIDPLDKDKVESMLKQYGIELKNAKGYDAVYVANMAMADFMGSAIQDNQHLIMYVRDYIDDPDGYEGKALTQYYADCIGKGEPIEWEDMI